MAVPRSYALLGSLQASPRYIHLILVQCICCSELTVDNSESLGYIDRVYSDSGVRSTKVGDDDDG